MSKPNEDRDVYYIPPNFLTSGRLFGGMIRARNAIEACVLVLLTGVPIIKLPFSLTTRIIILCLVSLPLGIFGVIGFEGDSLSEFAVNWVRWLIHRRTLYRSDTPVPEAPEKPMKAVSGMSAPKPPEQLGIKIKENPKKRKKRKPVKKLHKASKHKSSVAKKKQPLHAEDFIPVKDIRNGIIETTDDRYLRVIEVEPINFLLRNISEQKNIVASFASWMKISPVKVQIKVLTKKADSLAVLIPCVLYIAGIIAQFMININAWKAAGSDYSVSPGLPSLELADVFRSIFHFPEGLIAIGVVVVGIVLICIFGLRIGWGQNGVTDSDRNLTVSSSGSYGTASFMSPKEASACFDVTSAKKTEQDILGMLPDGQILTLPKNTRLNSNLAVCGSSGTGKSRSISRNLVLQAVKRGESLILTDPKSELYESMSEYLRDNGYTVKVFNLIEMDHSDSWNCLNEVGSSELMAQTFADIVLQNTSGDSKDAFWYNAELNLLKALVLYVALEMPPEQRNLATVYDLLYTQTEKGLSDIMASISHEHVNQYTGELLPPSPAAAPYAIFKQSSDTVRTSVIIGLGSKLAVLQAQQVRNITSYNEIDLELPGKQKCAYFCIVSDQDSTFDFLSSLFFSFLFIRLIRYADGYCEGGMLSTKVKFVLDEFPNCCLIPDFTKKCSTIRSRGCSVAVFFQNVGQMRNRYPDDQWQEILGACDSTVFLGCTDMLTAEYFSDRIGTASVEVEGTMRELNTMHITNYTPRFRKTNSLGRRQLLTPDEVLRLPPDQVLIFIRGQKVMRAKRYDYSLHPDYKKLKSRKAILHEPDWKTSQASSVSATGPSPSSSMATPVEKGSGNRQKKPPAKPARNTEREVVNADDIF